MADALSSTLDYLGRRQPIGQRNLSGLPTESGGGLPGGPVTGLPSDSGGAEEDAAPVGTTAEDATPITGRLEDGPDQTLSTVLQGLSAGKKITDIAGLLNSLGGNATSVSQLLSELGLEQSALGQVSGGELALGAEPWSFGMFSEPASQVSGGELALGAAEGASAADAALGGAMTLGQAAPIWGLLTALVDFLGEGKLPFEGLLNSIFHFNDPSQAWRTFPLRLQGTLQAADQGLVNLAQGLLGAEGPEAADAAVANWQEGMRPVIPGWNPLPGEIAGLPGATGERHEGRMTYDPNITIMGLRALQQAARGGQSREERQRAFVDAITGEIQRRRDAIAPYEADTSWTGSA